MAPSKNEAPNHVIQFLLAEYNAIYDEMRRTRSEGLNRLNFFITITTGALTGIALLYQVDPNSVDLLKLFSLGVLVLLVLIGVDTFRYLIARDINTDTHVRATARIRRFFVDQYAPIEPYLTWQSNDEPTKWIKQNSSSSRNTVQSMISVLCALAAGLVENLFGNNLLLSIIFTIASFMISFFFLHKHAQKSIDKPLMLLWSQQDSQSERRK